MNTAIICYSFTQNNLVLAGELITRTGGTLVPIEELSTRNRFSIFLDVFFNRVPRIREYLHVEGRFDHYILISPIWGGKIASPLKAYLLKTGTKIRSYSFISICGGGKDQVAGIEKELTLLLNKKPVSVTQLELRELCKDHPEQIMNYRVSREDLQFFGDKIDDFLISISRTTKPVATT